MVEGEISLSPLYNNKRYRVVNKLLYEQFATNRFFDAPTSYLNGL
jgi:hypothetical protein